MHGQNHIKSLFNTSINYNYSDNLVKGTRKYSKKYFLKYKWERYICFISTKFCVKHRNRSLAVYRHTVKSQSGSDVTQKNCFLTEQTVGCGITSVLLYTTRGYNVGRLFAEWAVTLCHDRVKLIVNEELEWIQMDVAVISFVYHSQVWSGDIGKP